MHEAKMYLSDDGVPLIHTSNLSAGVIRNSEIRVFHRTVLSGSLILLPRVGAFREDKICLYSGESGIVLSDCVIGIKSLSDSLTEQLYYELKKLGSDLGRLYHGTGAPYTTMLIVNEFLQGAGLRVVSPDLNKCDCSSGSRVDGYLVSA